MKRKATTFLVLMAGISLPSVALANAGTPLMWAGMLYLVFGNMFLGLFEGVLLACVYKVRSGRAIALMIAANYFSAWFGWLAVQSVIRDQPDLNLYNAWANLWEWVAVAYLATLVLEWPFVAGCFWGTPRWVRRSFSGSLCVQSISYVLLCAWFGLASGTSLYTKMSTVPLDRISLPANVLVCYIADHDGDVYVRELSTGRTEKVFDLNSTDRADCLSFEPSPSQSAPSRHDVVALLDSGDWTIPKVIRVGVSVPAEACPHGENGRVAEERVAAPSQGEASKLGAAEESLWTFRAGYWPIEGLRGENTRTNARVGFALETPFVQWEVRHAVLLPTDRVMFQLGKSQICVLEPETRKIALLTRGRGAVAVVKQP